MDYMIWAVFIGTMLMGAAVLCPNLRYAVTGDEDIKIATPGSFSKSRPAEDVSELEAQQFLRLKNDGSIDKARQLGAKYATILLEKNEAAAGDQDPLCCHQRLVLYSYVVNRAISDLSPNSLLAQTSLNVFYDELEEGSPELYRHVSDMAAFSLYILCERSNSRSEDEIGEVYARLCGSEGDRTVIDEGNALYRGFYERCREEFHSVGYESM